MAAELSFSTNIWFIDGWYNDEEVLGDCDLWDDFTLNKVPKKILRNSPEAIQFVSMAWPRLNITNFTCTTEAEVDGILTALSEVSPLSFSCDSHVWTVAECIAGSPSLCIDCLDPCVVQTSRCTDSSVEVSLSPCSHTAVSDDSCSYPIGLANMLSITFTPLAPAPSILNVASTDITASSIEVLVELSYAGYVHCLAISGGVAPASAEEISLLGISSSSLNVTSKFRFEGLLSAIEYNAYCSVESIDGTFSSMSEVMASAITVTTSCCKDLLVSTSFYTPFVKGTSLSDIIELSVAQLPTDSIRIDVHVFFNNTGNETVHNESSVIDVSSVLHPSSEIYFGNTPQENASLSMNALSHVGRYWVTLNVSGPSSSQYVINFDGSYNFEVVELAIEPPLPVIHSSHFVRDGSAVRVEFNASTDMNGILSGNFDCSRLFNFTASVGTKCKWISSAEVLIFSKVLNVAENITLFGSKLRARCVLDDCSHWKTVNETVFAVTSPPSVKAPILSVVASAFLGKCDDLSIDISSTSGSLGRLWADLTLKIVTSNDLSSKVADIQSILDGVEMNDYKKPIIIARSYLTATKSYSIQISIRNFLGGTATKTFTTTVLASSAPTVSIRGPSRREIQRRSAVVLTADAYTILCSSDSNESSVSQVGLEYNWKVYGSAGNPISGINSDFSTTSKVIITPFELETNNLYSIEVTVFDSILRISSSSSVSVFVKASDVVAIISQGSQLALPVDKEVLIDGSRSYDADKSVTPYSDFSYTWSCTKVSPTLSDACPLEFDITSEGNGVYVKAGTGAINSTSLISLLIVAQDLRTSSASILVDTVSPKSPFSSIDFDGSSLSKFNPDKKIIVRASVVTDEPCLMEWGIREEGFEVNPEFDFDSNTLTPTSRMLSLRQSQSQTSISSNLVIKPGALLGGTSYMLTLSCTNDFVSSQTLKITLNSPPQIGSLDITPAEGTALSTIFLFDAALWEDEDLPLTYEFGVKSNNVILPLQARSEVKTLRSRLSEGKEDKDYAVNVVLTVYDDLSSNATDTHEVTVTPLADELDSILNLFSDSGNMSQSDLSVTTSTLNVNNCSLSPNCADLYRHECTVVPHTCGDCVDGYVGDNGVNSECILQSDVEFLTNSRRLTIGFNSCDDCGLWETCTVDPVSSEISCHRIQKSCSDPDCSSHGSCVFRSTISPFESVDACLVGSLDCDVHCQCDSGYAGSVCSYTELDFEKKVTLRQKSSSSLLNLVRSEEVTADNLLSNIESIEALFQEEEEISLEMAFITVQILREVISNCGEYELSSNNLEKLMPPLDIILNIFLSNDAPTGEVYDLIDSLAYLIAADIIVGENVKNINGKFVRIQFKGAELANEVSLTLQRARTPYEIGLGIPVNSISFSTLNFDTYTEVIGWITTVNSSLVVTSEGDRTYNSDILSVRSIYASSKTQAIKLFDRQDFTLEILNTDNVRYSTDNGSSYSYTVTTVCEYDSGAEERDLICPGSGYQQSISCASGEGTYSFSCPDESAYQEPNCALVDEVSRSEYETAECRAVYFDEFRTICACNVDKITERDHATRSVPREMEVASVTEFKISIDPTGSSLDYTPVSPQLPVDVGTLSNRISLLLAISFLLCILLAYFLEYSLYERLYRDKFTAAVSPIKVDGVSYTVNHGIGNLRIAEELVEKALPFIFRDIEDLSLWDIIYNEVTKHHKWLSFVRMGFHLSRSQFSTLPSNYFREMILLTVHLMTALLSLTIVYFIYDDAKELSNFTCGHFVDTSNCTSASVAHMRFLGSFCEWDASNLNCETRTPFASIWSVTVAACVTALLATPVTVSVTWVLEEYCLARTVSSELHDYKNSGLIQLVPSFFVEWIIKNQTLSSFGTTYMTLRDYGLSKSMLTVMRNSQSDFLFLIRKVLTHGQRVLTDEDKQAFLESWGHSSDNPVTFVKNENKIDYIRSADNGESGLLSFIFKETNSFDITLKEMLRANIIAMKTKRDILRKLRHNNEPLEEAHVLKLLVEDLLSDDECNIFRAKCCSDMNYTDYIEPKSIVSRIISIIFVGFYCVVAISLIFFYGITRDPQSQLLWFSSVVAWLLLDIFIFQTAVVLVKEVYVPSLILQRVAAVKALVVRCVCELDSYKIGDKKFKWSLMAFSSARVASKFYASRLGELFMAISINLPRRSVDIKSYSDKAILKLNVHNCDMPTIISTKSYNWNYETPNVTRFFSVLSSYFFLSTFSISWFSLTLTSAVVAIFTRITVLLGITTAIMVLLLLLLVITVVLFTINVGRPLQPREKSVVDKQEDNFNLLGHKPYVPKKRKMKGHAPIDNIVKKSNKLSDLLHKDDSTLEAMSYDNDQSKDDVFNLLYDNSLFSPIPSNSRDDDSLFASLFDECEIKANKKASEVSSSPRKENVKDNENKVGKQKSSTFSGFAKNGIDESSLFLQSQDDNYIDEVLGKVRQYKLDNGDDGPAENASGENINDLDAFNCSLFSQDEVGDKNLVKGQNNLEYPTPKPAALSNDSHLSLSAHNRKIRENVLSLVRDEGSLISDYEVSTHKSTFDIIMDDLDETNAKNKFKPKRSIPHALEKALSGKSPDEKLRIIFHLADEVVTKSKIVDGEDDGVTASNQVLQAVMKKNLMSKAKAIAQGAATEQSNNENDNDDLITPSQLSETDANRLVYRNANNPYRVNSQSDKKILEPWLFEKKSSVASGNTHDIILETSFTTKDPYSHIPTKIDADDHNRSVDDKVWQNNDTLNDSIEQDNNDKIKGPNSDDRSFNRQDESNKALENGDSNVVDEKIDIAPDYGLAVFDTFDVDDKLESYAKVINELERKQQEAKRRKRKNGKSKKKVKT